MEAAAAAGRLPDAPSRAFTRLRFGFAPWLAAGVAAGAGAGLLIVTHERLAVALMLAALAALVIRQWPFAVLLVVVVLAARPSPIRDLVWFGTLTGGALVLLWRLPRAPGRLFLGPLALLLILALPLLNWTQPLIGFVTRTHFVLPVVHYDYLALPQEEATDWLKLSLVLVVGLLAALHVHNARRLRLLAGAMLAAGAYPVYVGIDQLLSGQLVAKDDFAAVRGTFDFPNEFGIFLVLFLLVAVVGLFEFRHTLLRLVLAVITAAALIDLLHTYTRAAWTAFAVGLLVLALLRYRRLLVVALVLLVIGVVGFPGAVNSVQARFGDLANQNAANAKNSLTWRRGQWDAMWHWGSERPVLGQGFGSYRRLTVREFGLEARTYGTVGAAQQNGKITVGFTAHNDFVKSWVESGALGLALWIAILVGVAASLIGGLRVPEVRPWAAGVLGAELGFVLMSLSDNVQAYTVPMLCLFALAGGIAGASKHARISSASRASA
jgi:O-antigen ligase